MPTPVTVRLAAAAAMVAAALAGPVGAATAAAPSPAAAPACTPTPLDAGVQRADAVFTGTVASATPSGTDVVHEVTVDRVYQGSVGAERVQVTTHAAGRCAIGQLSGQRYVFLVKGSGTAWTAGDGSGTVPADATTVQGIEALLGTGQPPTPPEPEEVRIESAGAGEPTPFTRLAAPGLALVLVGLLGLVVTRRLGRR